MVLSRCGHWWCCLHFPDGFGCLRYGCDDSSSFGWYNSSLLLVWLHIAASTPTNMLLFSIKCVLCALLISTTCPSAAFVSYRNVGMGLTDIDYHEIPTDVEEVEVQKNNLTSIILPKDYPRMTVLNGHTNHLTDFPDVTFVGDTLLVLKLQHNLISKVSQSRLGALTKLEELILTDNHITAFPDPAAPGPYHLKTLKLTENPLPKVPVLLNLGRNIEYLAFGGSDIGIINFKEVVASFPNLTFYGFTSTGLDRIPNFWIFPKRTSGTETTFKLENNPIRYLERSFLTALSNPDWRVSLSRCEVETIPNLLDLAISASIDLSENPLNCDCRLKWLKVASNTGIDKGSLTCARPSRLNKIAFEQVDSEDLRCEGTVRCG